MSEVSKLVQVDAETGHRFRVQYQEHDSDPETAGVIQGRVLGWSVWIREDL